MKTKLSDIKITKTFKTTHPSPYKLLKCMTYYARHGKLDRDIVLTKNTSSHTHVYIDGVCECGQKDPNGSVVSKYTISYVLNGADFKKVTYGAHLEKGVLCCLCKQNISKRDLQVS